MKLYQVVPAPTRKRTEYTPTESTRSWMMVAILTLHVEYGLPETRGTKPRQLVQPDERFSAADITAEAFHVGYDAARSVYFQRNQITKYKGIRARLERRVSRGRKLAPVYLREGMLVTPNSEHFYPNLVHHDS